MTWDRSTRIFSTRSTSKLTADHRLLSGALGQRVNQPSVIVEQLILKPTEEMIMYKCKDHWKLSDFNALKQEYKNEMERFNNVKKYVAMLTAQIAKDKEIIRNLL